MHHCHVQLFNRMLYLDQQHEQGTQTVPGVQGGREQHREARPRHLEHSFERVLLEAWPDTGSEAGGGYESAAAVAMQVHLEHFNWPCG